MHLDPWTDLYRLSAWACYAVVGLVAFAVAAFFIWPYLPADQSTQDLLALLYHHRLGGLMSVDLPMLVICLVNLIPILGLYAALREVNPSYALCWACWPWPPSSPPAP